MIRVSVFTSLRVTQPPDQSRAILSQEDIYHIKCRAQLAFPQINSQLALRGLTGRITDYKETFESRESTVTMATDDRFQEPDSPSLRAILSLGWKLFKIESRSNNRYDHERSKELSRKWNISYANDGTDKESDQ